MAPDVPQSLAGIFARAATIDELLSDAHIALPGQRGDAELAARRLAAWCRAAASGDWDLFRRRLDRDGLSIDDVLCRFARVRRVAPAAQWMRDAEWIWGILCKGAEPDGDAGPADTSCPFGDLLAPVVAAAAGRMRAELPLRAADRLTAAAWADLRARLLTELCELMAPALYERFVAEREGGQSYRGFVAATRSGGFRQLFEAKPVLLRLLASLVHQWIEASRELLGQLDRDLVAIRGEILGQQSTGRVARVSRALSDPHHFGRTVAVIEFENGSKVVHKPKDLRVDAAWAALVERLNAGAPVSLRSARVLTRDGYGWTEFIDTPSCVGPQDFALFFRRAGAWLALLHVFVTVDMHQENVVAMGAHPVPIDLETILQIADTRFQDDSTDAGAALRAAMRVVVDSVATVGLLPGYGKEANGRVFRIGGVTSNASPRVRIGWADVNTDAMHPVKVLDIAAVTTNVPHLDGRRGALGEYLDEFIDGFAEYAGFLAQHEPDELLSGFEGLLIRTVVRPTRYYYMLTERLRDHRGMDDGPCWSAQADFTVRMADWEVDSDPSWPIQRDERTAVLDLNIPHFTAETDGRTVYGSGGLRVSVPGPSGLQRARERLRTLDEAEIAWQVELIRQNTELLRPRRPGDRTLLAGTDSGRSVRTEFLTEAGNLACSLGRHAIRRADSAAWVGLDWLDDSEMSQLVVLGPDLYNGNCGLAVFLGAHAAVTGDGSSRKLAVAAVARLRETLRGRNPARLARAIGIGGAHGMGSLAYGLAVLADLIADDDMLADACAAAALITDDMIATDRQLDVLGGSAGTILALLRLHRRTGAAEVLRTAQACGRHLLAQDRVGPMGRRMWPAPYFGRPLNGMAHGAAGYAYSLTALAAVTADPALAAAAAECRAFERSTFDTDQQAWVDLRDPQNPGAPCKWCYGAPGIGLSRLAMASVAPASWAGCADDVHDALSAVERGWPVPTDTLCCGTSASVEFLAEAGKRLGRKDLCEQADSHLLAVLRSARAAGDYRWSSGTGRFHLGLFRGIAGIGYTMLRRVEPSLPAVLVWE